MVFMTRFLDGPFGIRSFADLSAAPMYVRVLYAIFAAVLILLPVVLLRLVAKQARLRAYRRQNSDFFRRLEGGAVQLTVYRKKRKTGDVLKLFGTYAAVLAVMLVLLFPLMALAERLPLWHTAMERITQGQLGMVAVLVAALLLLTCLYYAVIGLLVLLVYMIVCAKLRVIKKAEFRITKAEGRMEHAE